MINIKSRNELRRKRQIRVRAKISGTNEVPRLNVFRSNKYLSAQLIDDTKGITLVSATTKSLDLENKKNIQACILLGKEIAIKAKKANISKIVFDRAGYLYHGKIKAFADSARENGLEF